MTKKELENKIKAALDLLENAVSDAESSSKKYYNGEINTAFMSGFLQSRIKNVIIELKEAEVKEESLEQFEVIILERVEGGSR
jgi:hypothetical protein